MNKEIEKKEYVAPAMIVVDADVQSSLLACSGEGFFCGEDDEIVDAP